MKKLCLIGCGNIGRWHLDSILKLSDRVETVGFCDYDEERALGCVRASGGGRAYTDHRVMLDSEKPDAVLICVPPYCHGEIELDVISRGIHFFVEKPVALDIDTARRIRDAAEEKGLFTSVGFQCRYSHLAEPCRDFCSSNEIVYVNCSRVNHVPSAFWWRDKELSGGQIVEQSIHQLDMLRYMMGEPEQVFTYSTRGFVKGVTDYNTDDCSVTVVKLKNGALCTFASGCYSTDGNSYDPRMIFSSRSCRAELKLSESLTVVGDKNELRREKEAALKESGILCRPDDITAVYSDSPENESFLCIKAFVDAVDSADPGLIKSSYRDGVRSLSFALACNRSMETGLPVSVDID